MDPRRDLRHMRFGSAPRRMTGMMMTTPRQWMLQHMRSMLGSCIALWTAYYRRRFAAAQETRMAPSHLRTGAPAHRLAREAAIVVALALVIFSPAVVPLFAQAPPSVQQGPDLVGGLKSTPGVLGVETARTSSGKQVIFAWFENKQAVLNWFYSETHQTAMRMFSPGASAGRAPLADIKDDSGPILAIASLTLVDKPQVEGVKLPVSQIAVELYAPLPGGLAAGGRFAPAGVKVPGLVEAPATR